MTLDEAIEHAEKVAKGQEESAEMWHSYPESHYANHLAQKAYDNCKKCSEEHRQLAEWLQDYKRLLEQEPCEDAISRQAVIDIVKDMRDLVREDVLCDAIKSIQKLPPVQPARKIGKWVKNDKENPNDWHCSRCGAIVEDFEQIYHNWLYCYHCGAQMAD